MFLQRSNVLRKNTSSTSHGVSLSKNSYIVWVRSTKRTRSETKRNLTTAGLVPYVDHGGLLSGAQVFWDSAEVKFRPSPTDRVRKYQEASLYRFRSHPMSAWPTPPQIDSSAVPLSRYPFSAQITDTSKNTSDADLPTGRQRRPQFYKTFTLPLCRTMIKAEFEKCFLNVNQAKSRLQAERKHPRWRKEFERFITVCLKKQQKNKKKKH